MSYTGTKSYNSTFRDPGSRPVSGQEVVLTGLISDTNYSIVVIATNTAGFRSSDPVFGITLTGRKLPPHTLLFSTSPPLALPTMHLFTITPPHTTCLLYPLYIFLQSSSLTDNFLPSSLLPPPLAPPPLPPIVVPPTSLTTRREPRTYTLTISRGSNMGGQVRLG